MRTTCFISFTTIANFPILSHWQFHFIFHECCTKFVLCILVGCDFYCSHFKFTRIISIKNICLCLFFWIFLYISLFWTFFCTITSAKMLFFVAFPTSVMASYTIYKTFCTNFPSNYKLQYFDFFHCSILLLWLRLWSFPSTFSSNFICSLHIYFNAHLYMLIDDLGFL